MHKIIQEFVQTGEMLVAILERNIDTKQLLESVFLKVVKGINNDFEDKKLVLEIDQAIINGHADNDVYMLFIANAIFRLGRMENTYRLERAKSLISFGSTLSQEKIQPVVYAHFMLALANCQFWEGNYSDGDELIKKALTLIDKQCLRYRKFFFNLAASIGAGGILNYAD